MTRFKPWRTIAGMAKITHGGRRKGAGRKPSPDARDAAVVFVRLSSSEAQALDAVRGDSPRAETLRTLAFSSLEEKKNTSC